MEKEVFDAIYNKIDGKTTEELRDIVNNHLNDYSDDQKWMITVVLSKRKVQFPIDDFPSDVKKADEKVWVECTGVRSVCQ